MGNIEVERVSRRVWVNITWSNSLNSNQKILTSSQENTWQGWTYRVQIPRGWKNEVRDDESICNGSFKTSQPFSEWCLDIRRVGWLVPSAQNHCVQPQTTWGCSQLVNWKSKRSPIIFLADKVCPGMQQRWLGKLLCSLRPFPCFVFPVLMAHLL